MKQKSIQYNFIMNFILTASSIIFPLITFPYVSRILLPAGTGKVAFATSVISYFSMIAMLGLPTYGVRAVAQAKEDPRALSRTVHELLIINLVMTLISYGLFFICLFAVPQMASQKELMIISSAAILLNSMGVTWFYQGMEEYTYITWVSLFFKVVSVITMFLFVRTQTDYIWYGVMSVLSAYGSGLVNFVRIPRYLQKTSLKELRFARHLKPILTFFAMTVATTIYTNLDTVMLGMMTDDWQVGLYNAAIKIKTLLVTLITSLGTVLLPRLSVFIERNNREDFMRVISKAFSFVLLFSVPVCLFCTVYASSIISLISGEAYLDAAATMQILMPTLICIGLSNITGIQILIPLGRENRVLLSVCAGAAADLLINLLLIPWIGPAGAAIGTLCAEILVLIWQCMDLKDILKSIAPHVEWRPLILCLLASFPFLLVSMLTSSSLTPFWTLAAGAAAYFGVYAAGLVVCKESIVTGILDKLKK